MRATIMYGAGDVRVEDVPDPTIVDRTDAIIRIVRGSICTAICGRTTRCRRARPARAWATRQSERRRTRVPVRPLSSASTPPPCSPRGGAPRRKTPASSCASSQVGNRQPAAGKPIYDHHERRRADESKTAGTTAALITLDAPPPQRQLACETQRRFLAHDSGASCSQPASACTDIALSLCAPTSGTAALTSSCVCEWSAAAISLTRTAFDTALLTAAVQQSRQPRFQHRRPTTSPIGATARSPALKRVRCFKAARRC